MHNRESRRSEKGQISIMVGIMMSTFIFFFAFVINTGMLVNAKINLQNAADLAAYAGAAVQARQLTNISYLNYEMRRQWKKLLFRIYVVGNMAQDSFPRGGGTGRMEYSPDGQPNNNWGVPASCVVFNQADNYCHLTSLPAISIPAGSQVAAALDSITATLNDQLQAIETIRQKNCQAIGQTNKMLNILWLFNADPNLSRLNDTNLSTLSQDQVNAARIIQGLATGLGIVPREIILRSRIKTLNGYVNTPPQQALDVTKANGLRSGQDPPAFERSIQAFFSAYYTLGNYTFPSDSITMDELTPGTLLILKDIKTKLDTLTVDLTTGPSGTVGGSIGSPSSCDAKLVPISLGGELPVGVYKDPKILTYYAIRLKAKAQILFSPFGAMTLKAYSAAQPFGSRIGPNDQDAVFSFSATANTSNGAQQVILPNLRVKDQSDNAEQGSGWDRKDVAYAMFSQLLTPGSVQVSPEDMERTYQYAMAPNPWERNRYNIINDGTFDSFVRNFDISDLASIWAPVYPPDKVTQIQGQVQSDINALFTSPTQNVGSGGVAAIQGTLASTLQHYIETAMRSNGGEKGESINVAKITNPLKVNGRPINNSDSTIFVTDPMAIRTSWNSVNSGDLRAQGRVGYSVKFVSFDSLRAHPLSTNGQVTWTNFPEADPEGDLDIPAIKH